MVLTSSGSLKLSVRRLICVAHRRAARHSGVSFFITNPIIWQQLLQRGLRISPDIFVVNAQTILSREAYR